MLKLYLIREDIFCEIECNGKLKEPQLESAESNLVIFVILMYFKVTNKTDLYRKCELERLFKQAVNTLLRCA